MIYADAYLAGLVTPEREARANSDVSLIGPFPCEWYDRLVILRVYILTCLECTTNPDDTFAAKLSFYRKEYEYVLTCAKTARDAEVTCHGHEITFGSIPLLRG